VARTLPSFLAGPGRPETHLSCGEVGVCVGEGRVFVHLPLVGENRDDDENQRKRGRQPGKRERLNACLRGRHRPLSLHAGPEPVKSAPKKAGKTQNTIDSGGRRLHSGSSMSRTPNATKSIFAFVARITLR
jgi:hypothetical protein